MLYDLGSCDLYVCGAGPDVYRLNLEQGRFLSPFTSTSPLSPLSGNNCLAQSSAHPLLAVGREDGAVCRKGAVVDGGLAVRRWSIHNHMSARDSEKRGGKGHKSVDSGRHCVNAVGIVPDEVWVDFGKKV